MFLIGARNVNDALSQGLLYLNTQGGKEPSRNGEVLVSPCPVTTLFALPTHRVLFSPIRDANPFFHLMEALWMLSGRDDLAWPQFFNSRFGEFSDDGATLNGAYGFRWRQHFEFDQIFAIVQMLKADPSSRRAVLQMWDAHDLRSESKDLPCNTVIYFRVREGRLDMTVSNRSNDIYWGAYGANAVHMSILLEFMASAIGVEVGFYYQISNNYHLYTNLDALNSEAAREFMATRVAKDSLYELREVTPAKLVTKPADEWMSDLNDFMTHPLSPTLYCDDFFKGTAHPMFAAYYRRKMKLGNGLAEAQQIEAPDWRRASIDWIERRL
jgi:thymidylate synthase